MRTHAIRGRNWAAALAAAALGTTALTALAPGATAAGPTVERFVVLYADGATPAQARTAVRAAGGTVLKENRAAGVAVVSTTSRTFRLAAARQRALGGVARDRYIGYAPPAPAAPAAAASRTAAKLTAAARPLRGRDVERDRSGTTAPSRTATAARTAAATGTVGTEPLASLQWDMQMMHTTEAQRRQDGDRRVLVGVMDTGVDGRHPDIAPNFNRALSRNFVRDIPTDPAGSELDGPCEVASCVDPVDVDDNEHGTHVASTIASPVNGQGVAGVAPGVQIVNVRAGQDSGYFFLMPTLDAMTYSGDAGIDVVNMSFYTDPWLFNCTANPADSPAEQEEQRVIIKATQRAIDYAYARGTTFIAAAGNEFTDLSKPSVDETSPDYPQATKTQEFARSRQIDPKKCLSVPAQSNHVLSVSAVGSTGTKSYYSNYGVGEIDVAAPGGDTRNGPLGRPAGGILAAAPAAVLRDRGDIDAAGNPTPDSEGFVIKDHGAYYQYLQGTSMAAPHAAGVAALIVSQYGAADRRGGFGLAPGRVAALLQATATEKDCPTPATVSYHNALFNATCEGGPKYTSFYGHGIVDALAAVNAVG